MKKILSLILTITLVSAIFAGCSVKKLDRETTSAVENEVTTDGTPVLSESPVRVLTLMGPTGMGMAKLIADSKEKSTALNYEFSVAGAPDEFVGDIVQGNFEFAAVPTNLAATLYAKTNGAVSVVAVNTLGVLYLIENGETVHSIKDLEGKTVYSSGQGAVPEYALNYILDAFGVKCNVIYESEHDVVVSDLVTNKASLAILPEPKVTAVLKTNEALKSSDSAAGLRIALDLNELWNEACEKKGDSGALYMGCIIVNNEWADSHPDELSAFLKEYEVSVNFINSSSTAAKLIVDAGIIPTEAFARAALPNSNIVFITGDEMFLNLKGFYQILFNFNPKSIGGAMPEDTFYRTENSFVIVD